MTYERSHVNRNVALDEVAVKKSTLTALAIAIAVLLAVVFLMVWQNYEQSERIDDLSNHQTYAARSDTQPASATQNQ